MNRPESFRKWEKIVNSGRSLGITPLEGPRFRSLRLGYGLPEQRSDMLHGAESPANRNYTASPTPCTPRAAGVTHPLVL